MKKIVSLLAVAVSVAISAPASAAVFDFTSYGNSGLGASETFTVGLVTVEATFFSGLNITDGSGGTSANGRIGTAHGLGVLGGDKDAIDGAEGVLFEFSAADPLLTFQINSLTAKEQPDTVTGDARIRFFADGAQVGSDLLTGPLASTRVFSSLVSDSLLVLNADGAAPENFFRILSLNVSPVPLPGAALLFGSAMAAVGAARRFKKKAAAAA